ncbi:hypothetical protein MLD38_007752 [Melastoma candidum]|uniref:Uncharacterized protein n=1 Tax=Melastoma candidum TaxID=119954 RepID=A0ACB9RS34_9MYRT|nr:hypothetical protein MLD38_007752 [Melastoma candidum]
MIPASAVDYQSLEKAQNSQIVRPVIASLTKAIPSSQKISLSWSRISSSSKIESKRKRKPHATQHRNNSHNRGQPADYRRRRQIPTSRKNQRIKYSKMVQEKNRPRPTRIKQQHMLTEQTDHSGFNKFVHVKNLPMISDRDLILSESSKPRHHAR